MLKREEVEEQARRLLLASEQSNLHPVGSRHSRNLGVALRIFCLQMYDYLRQAINGRAESLSVLNT